MGGGRQTSSLSTRHIAGVTLAEKIRAECARDRYLRFFHAFHGPDFPPSRVRLCAAGFMTRFGGRCRRDRLVGEMRQDRPTPRYRPIPLRVAVASCSMVAAAGSA